MLPITQKNLVVRSKAPLRLGLAGGGTDVSPFCDLHGGAVLNATIDMHAYCTIEAIHEQQVTFEAADRDEYEAFSAAERFPLDDKLILHKAVYNRIVRQFNRVNRSRFV